ncbi:MAG: SUMF1/EgtB/PvdO family nonheme iron enzyme [Chitinivibrionales bacterium]|nr:SUMF1/EgtB/PvdO family nonheme iron enzyme [Chitinivibrionales bacterium]
MALSGRVVFVERIVLLSFLLISSCSILRSDPEKGQIPAAVTLLQPQHPDATGCQVRWSSATSELFGSYKLYFDTMPPVTTSSRCVKVTVDRADTTFTFTFLKSNTTYYVKVVVFNATNSSESNIVSFQTPACTCGEFTATKSNDMVLIPAGCFQDSSGRQVSLTRPFYMDTTEITVALWNEIMKQNTNRDTVSLTAPRTMISWFQMILFCNKRSVKEKRDTCYTYTAVVFDTSDVVKKIVALPGLKCNFIKSGYRLPTEDEWEYAYRASSTTDFFWGKSGNFASNNSQLFTYPKTQQDTLEINRYVWWTCDAGTGTNNKANGVGRKQPNKWHLYDMAGNVSEFVWDGWAPRPLENQLDYHGPASSTEQVYRGGDYRANPMDFTASTRSSNFPEVIYNTMVGFRTVRTAE